MSPSCLGGDTEEGRLFHSGKVLGKKKFLRASLQAKYLVYCKSLVRYCHFGVSPVNYSDSEMPLFFADLVPGSDTYLYQETLYQSES